MSTLTLLYSQARLCMISECCITLFDLCVAPLCLSGPNIRRFPPLLRYHHFVPLIIFAAFAFLWLLPGLLRDLHTEGWKEHEYQLNFRLLCLQVPPDGCVADNSVTRLYLSACRSASWTSSFCPSHSSRSSGVAFSRAISPAQILPRNIRLSLELPREMKLF
jgi:hypothetical protein